AAVGGQIGSIVASLLAAWIIPTYGWNTLFLFGVVPVVLTYFVRRHVKESDEFLAAHKKAEETGEKISFGRLFETPRLALQTLGLMLMTIVQIAGYFGLMNWLPSIVQKKQGLSVSGSSYWMIATIIGMSIGIMVFGTIMDKICPRWAFGIFLLGSAVVVFAIVNVTSYWTMLLAGALTGFFSNGMFGGYGAVISQLYPTEIRSTANNLIMNTGRAIGGFSSVIIGALMDHYNLYVVMGFLSALYIISFLVMISLPGLREIQTKKRVA
ncbi:MFS transporter, partial [Lactobacillus delbrueckii subsp. bulgaricus]|nr:MFS transporter [Lactobacillus delbrueckii subsp. bulgaricus]